MEDIPETGTVIVGVEEVVRQKETRQEEPEDDYDPYSQTNHPTIEETVASGREEEDERGVFDPPTPEGIKHRSLFNFTWIKHIKETVTELYDDMNNEGV